jgi:hypothetical protein
MVTAALLALLFAFDGTPRPMPARSAPPARTLTACMAVTRAEVEAALGRKVGAGAEEIGQGSSTCDYTGAGGQVTVTIQHLGAPPDLDQEIASLKAEFPGSSVRQATVKGAVAFYLDIGESGTLLHVIRGGRDYVLNAVLGLGAPSKVSRGAAALAATALAKIGDRRIVF